MMLSEFEKLTGLEVTTAEYEKIEAEYMESPDDKAKFCKMWLKKGGLQRLHNARLEEIEHLKKTIEDLEHKLDEEQDWQISHKYGTHYQKTSYDHLTKRCSNGHQFESEAKAAEFISSQYGFDKDRIVFIHDVEVYETNRHGITRLKERLTRFLTMSVAEQTMHVSMCAAAAEVCNGNLWTELLKTIPHRHFYPMGSNSSSRIITPHRPQ